MSHEKVARDMSTPQTEERKRVTNVKLGKNELNWNLFTLIWIWSNFPTQPDFDEEALMQGFHSPDKHSVPQQGSSTH